MAQTRTLDLADLPTWVASLRRPHHDAYYAMYSSVYRGIVTDPVLMMVPVDDHLVHRGDGVFETMKCVDGGIYNLLAHLDRLAASARHIELDYPWLAEELSQLVVETVKAGGRRDCAIRVLISRGPGGLGVNPYESSGPELYIIAARFTPRPHPVGGVKAGASRIPVKAGFFANVKCCNYLPNVLMKKEAVDRALDYVLSFDEKGCLAEGPAESAAVVDAGGALAIPRPDRILPGTTMERVAVLAEELVAEGLLSAVVHRDIERQEMPAAREVLVCGTSPDVVSVVEWEGLPVGAGTPGPVGCRLGDLLKADLQSSDLRTPVLK